MPLALFRRRSRPLRARLWLGCGALAVYLLTAVASNFWVAPERAVSWKALGHDFLAFYTAGTFACHGRADALYDLSAVGSFQQQVAASNGIALGDGKFAPYWNPPFYAWLFAPLSRLSFPRALLAWTAINLLALLGAVALLRRMYGEQFAIRVLQSQLPFSEWALIPALIITSAPFILALGHGQNTFISLLLVCATVACWRRGDALFAGLLAGLLFYKPQLGAIVALVLVVDLGWRALAGLAITGAAMLCITCLTLPGTLEAYVRQLPLNVREFQVVQPYMWERHVTLKAFWRLLVQGGAAGEVSPLAASLAFLCALALFAALVVAAFRARRARAIGSPSSISLARDRVIAATLCATPLLMPFYFDYDLLLLAVPAVLLAGEVRQRRADNPADRSDRWLTRAWIALAMWLFINASFASATRVNLAVVLLAGITFAALRRSALVGFGTDCEEHEFTSSAAQLSAMPAH